MLRITIDSSNALSNIKQIKDNAVRVIIASLKSAANALLKDSRKYVPIDTGQLRDSGRVEEESLLAMRLIWDAASEKGFIYAQKQYSEVLNHIDGRYAAKWVEKAFNENQQKYLNIFFLSFNTGIAQQVSEV